MSLLGAWQEIRKSQGGGSDAFWAAVRSGLSNLARGLTSNDALAEELVAVLCLSLVRRASSGELPGFAEARLLRGYLKASLEKALASYLRQQARERATHALELAPTPVADAETQALQASAERRREDRSRERLKHSHRLVETLATAAIGTRLPRYWEDARRTWAELKAVHLDRRDLDDVIRAADGPVTGAELMRARLRRYQSFRRFRERMLELARERHARGELTELDVRSATALVGLELMAFQLSSPPRRRDPSSKPGA